jgi:DNA-binding FadR family transcriptional regulator
MQSGPGERVDLIEEDLLFHRTIFEMSGNRVCRLIFSIVHELLHNLMEITSRLVDSRPYRQASSPDIQRDTQTRRSRGARTHD